jgi:hypothetical protein
MAPVGAARNALVKATKDAGDHTARESLKALRKPDAAQCLPEAIED